MSAILITMRLTDMHRVHPDQITGKCADCGHTVGIYPSGQNALKEYPDLKIVCQVCRPGGRAELVPGAELEPSQSVNALDPLDLVFMRRSEAYGDGKLDLWTIYVNPTDRPGDYMARRFILDQPTGDVIAADTLMEIRQPFIDAGFVCLTRNETDEPHIVETWL